MLFCHKSFCFGCFIANKTSSKVGKSVYEVCNFIINSKKISNCVYKHHASIEENPCEGWPKSATTEENIRTIHNMVLDDQQLMLYDKKYVNKKERE